MNKLILVFILSLLVVPCVAAIGVTPGKNSVSFSSGKEETFIFSVVNTEAKDISVLLAVQGELADFVTLSQQSLSMSADEQSREVSYTLKLPDSLPPGAHSANIVVLEVPEQASAGDAVIGATVAVVTQLQVNVDYPGKYAEASLNVLGPDDSGNVNFVVPVISRGEFDITNVRVLIDVYSSLNEKVASLESEKAALASKERREFVVNWDAKSINPGPYRALATVIYDEDTLNLEKDFLIGHKRLSLEKIEVRDFSLGDIAKFEILIENKWSETVRGVYSQLQIYGEDGSLLAEPKSPAYDIEPLTKTLMISYWDTAGVKEGTYDTTLLLNYGENSEKQDLKLEVKQNEINVIGLGYVISNAQSDFGNNLVTIFIVVVVVLVLINASWFLFLRKKLQKKHV